MPGKCVVSGCKETHFKGSRITFHSFPKDEKRKKLWLHQIPQANIAGKNYITICSMHFKDDCFDKNRLGGTWLKPDAIPTIFNFPKQQQERAQPRQQPLTEINVTTEHQSSISNCKSALPYIVTVKGADNQCITASNTSGPSCNSIEKTDVFMKSDDVPTLIKLSDYLKDYANRSLIERKSTEKQSSFSSSQPDISNHHKEMIMSEPSYTIRGEKRRAYVGDFHESDLNSPENLKRLMEIVHNKMIDFEKKARGLKQHNRQLKQKVATLKETITELKKKNSTSESALSTLKDHQTYSKKKKRKPL